METVCLICGDIGFIEALVLCNKCEAHALHRYCLDGPVIFVDDVTWFCEYCEPKPIVPYSLDQSKPLSSIKSDSVNLANNAIQAKRELKNCIKRSRERKQRQQKKIREQQEKVKKNGSVAKTKVLLSDSPKSPDLEDPQCSISCEQQSKSINENGLVPIDALNCNGAPKSIRISRVTATDDSNRVASDCDIVAQPIADPIWRGSLYFSHENIGTVDGLLAHLSCLACPKVLDETTLLPEVLSADLLPRAEVWPNSFKVEGPTDKSIALYFFPESESSENEFGMLVDHIIDTDVGIRIVAINAELLIFPSTVLPTQHRRFQAKYYLWGVFRYQK